MHPKAITRHPATTVGGLTPDWTRHSLCGIVTRQRRVRPCADTSDVVRRSVVATLDTDCYAEGCVNGTTQVLLSGLSWRFFPTSPHS